MLAGNPYPCPRVWVRVELELPMGYPCHALLKIVVFGSKSSRSTSERVGLEAERCGGPVRGSIVLETRENASIRVDFDAGGSWEEGNIVPPCLGLGMDETGSEWRQNTSRCVAFDAGRFPECKRGVSQGFAKGKSKNIRKIYKKLRVLNLLISSISLLSCSSCLFFT